VSNAPCQVRRAEADDAEAVAGLAAGLAQSFAFSRDAFGLSYPALFEKSAVYFRKVLGK
jgi:hypothetical protein